MAENSAVTDHFTMVLFIVGFLIGVSEAEPGIATWLPAKDIADKFRNDSQSLKLASTDYGYIVKEIPATVFYPTSTNDIISLVRTVYDSSVPVKVAARGQGHSVRGQAMARGGVVVKHGLAPISWTDYLYLTVGGTLSNAGISGQTFRVGPQVTNVYELDVITGKGDFVTCSAEANSELYHAVLGGLGQFGIITRARIALETAPTRVRFSRASTKLLEFVPFDSYYAVHVNANPNVKWLRLLYDDFAVFSGDQERLISINGGHQKNVFSYVEGFLLLNQGSPDVSFYPIADQMRVISLVTSRGIIYCLEVVKYYDDRTENMVDKELRALLKGLGFLPGFSFGKDVPYTDFLNRVRSEEQFLRSKGLWDVPHPWLNLFVPKSRISDFNSGVLKGIVLKQNITAGLVIIYPMNRNKLMSMTNSRFAAFRVNFPNPGQHPADVSHDQLKIRSVSGQFSESRPAGSCQRT
ncbi:Cytokinin dehydrogenase 3 [Morella rubra]|uniref:Cytokinin dehydrogenase 3 n=1 Tax=Morella rubra TaxID=262757 RepID=A0A6A1USH8_9ROSI|nr:Cytokinin dehydrogenase 3 [Morella rubra]